MRPKNTKSNFSTGILTRMGFNAKFLMSNSQRMPSQNLTRRQWAVDKTWWLKLQDLSKRSMKILEVGSLRSSGSRISSMGWKTTWRTTYLLSQRSFWQISRNYRSFLQSLRSRRPGWLTLKYYQDSSTYLSTKITMPINHNMTKKRLRPRNPSQRLEVQHPNQNQSRNL